nr:unnamed protein product [Callosobruchus analis]
MVYVVISINFYNHSKEASLLLIERHFIVVKPKEISAISRILKFDHMDYGSYSLVSKLAGKHI